MKRYLIILLSLLTCVSSIGCGDRNGDVRVPVNFYYRAEVIDYNSAQGVVTAEVRESAGYENDLTALVDLYLCGPETEGLLSPFPTDVRVESITQEDSLLQIVLSKEFGSLSGHNLSVACSCLSMTLIDLTQCQAVRIYAREGLLDGSEYVEMSRDSILLLDKYTTPSES